MLVACATQATVARIICWSAKKINGRGCKARSTVCLVVRKREGVWLD